MVSKIQAGSFLVWHVKGKVTLAKCLITGKFVKRASAQQQLNITLSDMTQYTVSHKLARIDRANIVFDMVDLKTVIGRYTKANYKMKGFSNIVKKYYQQLDVLKLRLAELEWCK